MRRLLPIIAVLLGAVILAGAGCATVARSSHQFYIDFADHVSAGSFAIVVDGTRFRDVETLKRFVARLGRGSSLVWVQQCMWVEGQPLMTQAEVDDLRQHCEQYGVILEIAGDG